MEERRRSGNTPSFTIVITHIAMTNLGVPNCFTLPTRIRP